MGDSSVRLQEKPLRLLTVLLDNPQRLVTRDQLRERMWDNDTFVDFELGINVAAMKVRDALGDSAEKPRFIQTVSKKGYRFLLPVEVLSPELTAPTVVDSPSVAADPPTAQATPNSAHSAHSVRNTWLIAALAAVVLSAFGLWLFEIETRNRDPGQIHSLAVLPLRNLSPDSSQDYLADGITEDLITNLAQSLPLRVISRTSVMRYKQTSEPIGQIARQLGVEAIVEGAVARSGNRVAVTVQLIDATEDRHLWAQKYERKIEDLLAMEAELSQEIASQVSGKLTSQRAVKVARPGPADPQVYELYLLGRYQWNKRTADGLLKAIEYLQQAIKLDPNYAPAYAGLADAYVILPTYDSVDREKSFDKASGAARHALELDDTLAEAHATLGLIAVNYWLTQSAEADREFRRALELNPSYATAHQWYAYHLALLGRRNDALAEMKLARQLDPLSAIINADEGSFLYLAGHNGEARERLQQAIELAPNLSDPHEGLALIDLEENRKSDALQEARAGLALDATSPGTMADAGYVLAVTGHKEEARKLAEALDDLARRGSTLAIHPAIVYVGLGERGKALDALEEFAASEKGAGIHALALSKVFDALREEPRYQKLVAEAHRQNQ